MCNLNENQFVRNFKWDVIANLYFNLSKCKEMKKKIRNITCEQQIRILSFQDSVTVVYANTYAKFCTQREIQFFFQELKVKTLTFNTPKGFDEILRLQKDMHKILTRQNAGSKSGWWMLFLIFRPPQPNALIPNWCVFGLEIFNVMWRCKPAFKSTQCNNQTSPKHTRNSDMIHTNRTMFVRWILNWKTRSFNPPRPTIP